MFHRNELKFEARQIMSRQYDKLFFVTCLLLLLNLFLDGAGAMKEMPPVAIAAIVLQLLVAGPIGYATAGYFLEIARREEIGANGFFSALGEIGRTVAAGLWLILCITGWMMLLIVPGIIKALSYSQYYYILHDNPELNGRSAMHISERMMRGYKMELFLLQLSFLGWILLILPTFGLILFYLIPYYQLTMAGAYEKIRNHALEEGICDPEEFGITETKQTMTQDASGGAPTVPIATPYYSKQDIRQLIDQIGAENPVFRDTIAAAEAVGKQPKKDIHGRIIDENTLIDDLPADYFSGAKNTAETTSEEIMAEQPQGESVAASQPAPKAPKLDLTDLPADLQAHMQALNKMAGVTSTPEINPEPPISSQEDVFAEVPADGNNPAYRPYVFPAVAAMQKDRVQKVDEDLEFESLVVEHLTIRQNGTEGGGTPHGN